MQDKGSAKLFLPYLYVGVQHSLQNIGMRSMSKLKGGVNQGEVKVELRIASGFNSYTKWLCA